MLKSGNTSINLIIFALILLGLILGIFIGIYGFSYRIVILALAVPFAIVTILRPIIAVLLFFFLLPLEHLYVLQTGFTGTLTKLSGIYLVFIIVITGYYRYISESFKINTTIWIIIFVLVAFFSVIIANDTSISIGSLRRLVLTIIAYFAIILMIRDIRSLDLTIVVFMIGMTISSLSSLYLGVGKETTGVIDRSGGLWGDPNEFAALLLVNMIFCIAILILSKNIWFKLIAAVSFITSSLVFFTTYSRSGFIALSLVSLLALFKIVTGKNRAKRLAITVPCLIIALIFIYLFIPLDVISRIETLKLLEDEASIRSDNSMFLRYKFYFDVAPKVIIENPLFGVGLRNFLVHSPYEMISHNTFIEVLSGLGLVGFIPFMMIIFLTWNNLRNLYKRTLKNIVDYKLSIYASALELSLLVYLVVGLFYSLDLNKIMWIIITLSACLVNISRIQSATDRYR